MSLNFPPLKAVQRQFLFLFVFLLSVTNHFALDSGPIPSFVTKTATSLAASNSTLDFGAVCLGTSVTRSFLLSGPFFSGSLTVSLPGYTFSGALNGPYTESLTVSFPLFGGNRMVFMRLTPTAVQNYNGTVAVSGCLFCTDSNVITVTGSGVTTPTVSTGIAVVGNPTTTATVSGAIASNGGSALTSYGVVYSTQQGFTAGTTATSSNLSGTNFSVSLSGLQSETTYYYRTFASTTCGTTLGNEQSFTTPIIIWNGTSWNNVTGPTLTANALLNGNYDGTAFGVITVRNLTVASGVTVSGSVRLTVAGTITNNGVLNLTDGGLTLQGTTAQIIPANSFSSNEVKDLLVNNAAGVTLGGILNVTGTVGVSSGSLNSNGNLVLKSTATRTAQVLALPTGAMITGDVTVERYISGRRAFRFLTPAVTTTTSVRENWQNSGSFVPGLGTHITGLNGSTNGFDTTGTNNPSMHTYNAQAAGDLTGFTAITNTNTATLKAGVGYRLLVRGDRFVNLTVASFENMNVPTVLSAKGTLTTGTVTFSSSDLSPVPVNNNSTNTQTNGYTLIGNPYASPVDWHAVAKTGVRSNAYYTWNPTLGTVNQRGRYVAYSQTSANAGTTNLPEDSSTLSQGNRRYLQSGQAVFIKNAVLTTAATLVFTENSKANSNAYVFRSAAEQKLDSDSDATDSKLFLRVYEPNELALGGAPIDGAVALFSSNYTTALDANDVDKLAASGENIAFVRALKNLAIETLAPVTTDAELYVKTIAFQANKSYTFKVDTQDFDPSVSAKMVDLYLNTETPIDLTQPSFVTFSTTTDAASYGATRFKIVFNSASLSNESFTTSSVSVYPNPIVNNQFTIALPSSLSGLVTVRMSNMLGQEVFRTSADATPTMHIQPKQQLEEGIYVVSISNGGQVVQAKVVVKE